MKTFEYKEVSFSDLKVEHYPKFDVAKLNELGQKGWELVSAGGQCLFKRELVDVPPVAAPKAHPTKAKKKSLMAALTIDDELFVCHTYKVIDQRTDESGLDYYTVVNAQGEEKEYEEVWFDLDNK